MIIGTKNKPGNTRLKERKYIFMKMRKEKDFTPSLPAQVKSKKRKHLVWRIFTPYSKQIISQERRNVKSRDDIIDEILEVYDTVEKWRRILVCALLAACVTGLVLSVCGIVDMFLKI